MSRLLVGVCLFIMALPSVAQDTGKTWITIGADAVQSLRTNRATIGLVAKEQWAQSPVQVAALDNADVLRLSEYMHDQFHRCGGFIAHASEAEAVAAAKAMALPSQNLVAYSIDSPVQVNAMLSALNSNNMSSMVTNLSNYHNRYYTQQTGVDAATWIRNQWAAIANGRSDIQVELVSHTWAQPSVVLTITGQDLPEEIVVLGGHLDSINQSSPSTGRAPGSDDNASGIAVVTEVLRAIVSTNFKPARTIKLMGYAAEEVGLKGSQAIAQAHKNAGAQVVGVAQFDMSGYKGTANKDIVFMTDYTNSAQNNFMAQLIDTYLTGVTYGFGQCGYGCSDHASWHGQGYAASMPFESNLNQSNPNIHTAYDNTYDVGHSFKFAQLAAAYAVELAKPAGVVIPPPDNALENGVPKAGLAGAQGEWLDFTFDVPAGSSAIQVAMSGGSGDADLYVKLGSQPSDSSYDCRPYKNGNAESCSLSASGKYYVRIKGYSAFSGVTLTGSFSADGGGGPGEVIEETYTNVSVSRGGWVRYSLTLPAGYTRLDVTLSGGSGDGDLYVRAGSEPTTSSYDCRPYKNGNNESCSFNAPAAGTWHIGIRGYSAASGMTLNYKATP
ncbi:metalloprotease II [Simiduia agarivorans SA1 = DSM 21679]|uniref:Metalloprotease II n=2 Tax=Simiduia TaxID=447467 RepID=K4KRR3_SIMAS|nr:metalloprotease II [Simiduia agarivorans SA1 = DSM 21679]